MTDSIKARETSLIAVIVAAGVGKRFGASKPKQYLPLANSCVLQVTIERLLAVPLIDQVLLVVSASDSWYRDLPAVRANQVEITYGGKERVDSVANAADWIRQAGYSADTRILIHDAARPCVRREDITRLVEFQRDHSVAAILSCAVTDTIKVVDADNKTPQSGTLNGACRLIHQTPQRHLLRRALTPQLMTLDELLNGIAAAKNYPGRVTDDASLLELAGISVACLDGAEDNIKVTHPSDLVLAETILKQQNEEQ